MACVQMILKASSADVKSNWVRKLRQVIKESYLSNLNSAATQGGILSFIWIFFFYHFIFLHFIY